MKTLLLSSLVLAALLFALPAAARTSWVKPHTTKNGAYVSGHYEHRKGHISHAAKHRKHQG